MPLYRRCTPGRVWVARSEDESCDLGDAASDAAKLRAAAIAGAENEMVDLGIIRQIQKLLGHTHFDSTQPLHASRRSRTARGDQAAPVGCHQLVSDSISTRTGLGTVRPRTSRRMGARRSSARWRPRPGRRRRAPHRCRGRDARVMHNGSRDGAESNEIRRDWSGVLAAKSWFEASTPNCVVASTTCL